MATKSTKPKKTSQSEKQISARKKESQNRRELGGILCILLALFAALCCFNTDAFLLQPVAKFIGGLLGQMGRYLLPFVLVYTAVALFRGEKHPIKLRVFCTATLLLTIPAIVHIFRELLTGTDAALSISELYKGGQDWTTGGLLPGLLAELFEAAITKVGGILALLILIGLQVLGCMRITVNALISAIKNRPRMPKDKEKEEQPEVEPAERLVNRVQNKRIERYEKKHPITEYDLPVDDPPMIKQEEKPRQRKTKPAAEPEKPMPVIDAEERQVTIDEIELHDPEEPVKPVAVETDPVSGMPELKPETQKLKRGEAAAEAAEISQEIEKQAEEAAPEYVFPSISLLTMRRQGMVDATGEMRENSERLADTLKSFGI